MRQSLPRVAVIGLGRFGLTLARQLGQSGVEVIAIDSSLELVDQVKDSVTTAVRLDATIEGALEGQEIERCDVVVVAIGENFEAALLTTVLLKKRGIARVICRAQSNMHAEIYRQIGADEVIQPETQAGLTLARQLTSPHLEEVLPLADGYSLVELRAPAGWVQQTPAGLNLRAKYHVNLIAIKRTKTVAKNGQNVSHEQMVSAPPPGEIIRERDVLVLMGTNESLSRLPRE